MEVMSQSAKFTNRSNFSGALRMARRAQALPQEAFDQVSSRTYVSSLERGLKQPTLQKVDELAEVLGIHPLTLVAMSYLPEPTSAAAQELIACVNKELLGLLPKA